MMPPEILAFHIGAGSLAVASGAAALVFRKGDGAHRAAGTVFFLSMLAMAATGSYLAVLLPQRATAVVGIFTCYFLATAWMTVRRKERTIGLFEFAAPFVALGAAATLLLFGVQAQMSPKGLLDGAPPGPHYLFAFVAALACALDISVIVRRGLSGAQRIARHLWRMCAALFLAIASFIGQGSNMIPADVRDSGVLVVPAIVVVVVMLFWLVRVLLMNWYKSAPQSSP